MNALDDTCKTGYYLNLYNETDECPQSAPKISDGP